MTRRLLPIFAFLCYSLVGTAASAAPTYCSADAPLTTNADGLSTSDVTLAGSASDDCYGIVLNSNNTSTAADLDLWGTDFGGTEAYEGGDWEAVVKDDSGPSTVNFLGFAWTLDAQLGTTGVPIPGTWTLTLTDVGDPTPLPITVDLAVVLKGGNDWAAYLFDAQSFDTLNDPYAGTFVIKLANGNPNEPGTPALSHMSLYLRSTTAPPPPPPPPPDPSVPEPASLMLLGSGLVGLAAKARSRRKNAAK